MTDLDRTSADAVRPLAVVTGASSGIGYELARLFAQDGFDLILAADRPLAEAVQSLQALGTRVEAVQADLSSEEGVQALYQAIADRPVDALAANAGHGLGQSFLDESFDDILHVINTNITGTVRLVHLVGGGMRSRGRGRILFTGSIAGLMPGSFQAVYNASKAFVDSFSFALRNELKDTGVSVTVLMPGPTDTRFFDRADLMDTQVGQDDHKADPADVARTGYEAMNRGDGDVVAGLKNKVQAALAAVTPQSMLAEQHRKMAEPGTGG
ncbi:SDR family NAD(P)-dependent oxidoreductase [Brevundimonas sp.]|uniref:SDR family NAD(P)-dependent oxidoreductase n=1 Tax=Brevundimonas sp. TaxID=1871086 RepID=UPI0019BED7EE|nr:SDR family NAD(P)-dependent oxidoreductase [Brevundimonas sp.]MBD3837006.1 SDR family NAD(P)-dependent oxidoreductase [Brevundimonas sp.]